MSLKSDLYDVMKDMRDNFKTASNEKFADDVDSIITNYANACTLTVTPATLVGTDTTPSGTFSGSASVEWKFAGGKIAAKIKAVASKQFDQIKDDDLSKAIAEGLDSDSPTWTATLSGNTTVPGSPPVTSPSSDSGTVSSTFQSAPVKTALDAAFASMKTMINEDDDGDDVFATALATALKTYYASSVNSGKGASHLSGVQFAVLVTPGS